MYEQHPENQRIGLRPGRCEHRSQASCSKEIGSAAEEAAGIERERALAQGEAAEAEVIAARTSRIDRNELSADTDRLKREG
jgi:hypothetical protein